MQAPVRAYSVRCFFQPAIQNAFNTEIVELITNTKLSYPKLSDQQNSCIKFETIYH